ncbi:PLP-dependent aminotransferase family protein [Anaeromicrobium sediminis]|uniref:Uncharacterized protein n=1 Tax=Anaeromicrobium sediminis TaxID=1478221 RepID=A0A267MDT5_9FIRM|nr:hypothetical protein [Anaeromicrobium sediminis]PAB57719.1 hypothetical protein CCE28_18010 [Anaeromicrobium sediminis]
MDNYNKSIFHISKPGRRAYLLPQKNISDEYISNIIPPELLSDQELDLPEVSELDVIRHFTNLFHKDDKVEEDYEIELHSIKNNPKINEDLEAMKEFSMVHPYQSIETVQGSLEVIYKLDEILSRALSMDRVCLQGMTGVHGELISFMLMRAYYNSIKEFKRTKIIVSHVDYKNSKSILCLAGYEVVKVQLDEEGSICIDSLKELLDDKIAAIMLTNSIALDLKKAKEIEELVHNIGGLILYNGWNINSIDEIMDFSYGHIDMIHFDLNRAFGNYYDSGCGAIGVKEHLVKFLPIPIVHKANDKYILDYDRPESIGKIKGFYGNYRMILRAYTHMLARGMK